MRQAKRRCSKRRGLYGRDQLEAAIRLLERGDTLLAINPDRLARDTADLLTIGKRVVERGALLKIVDPAITFDGTDIMAEAMLTLFGMIGRIEKHFIKERQRRGIEAAKAKGVYKGRPPSIDPEKVRELAAQGLGGTEIARRLGIGRASVYRMLGAPAENMTEVSTSEVYREAIGTAGMAGLAGRSRTGLNRGAGSHENPAAAGKRAAADRL